MNEYIKEFIDGLNVNKKNLYFGYIFSLINQKKTEFRTMINNCIKNQIPYSFYDYNKRLFLDANKIPIHSIYNIVDNPFGTKPIISLEKNLLGSKRTDSLNKNPYFIIPENIKKKLINLLSEINNNDEIEELDFQESLNKCHIYYYHYDFFYTQDYNGKAFILIIKKGKFEV